MMGPIKPECCMCGLKFYSKLPGTIWHLRDVRALRGVWISKDYPFVKGLVCEGCEFKIKSSGLG